MNALPSVTTLMGISVIYSTIPCALKLESDIALLCMIGLAINLRTLSPLHLGHVISSSFDHTISHIYLHG